MTKQDKNYNDYIATYIEQAEQGDPFAQKLLGYLYNSDDYVKQDKEKANYWYKKSVKSYTKLAENGNADAQYQLGNWYFHGDGVKQDKEKAVYWYTKSAEQGNADAQYQLALMYHMDDDIQQNSDESTYWMYESAKNGNDEAKEYIIGFGEAEEYTDDLDEGLGDMFSLGTKFYNKNAEIEGQNYPEAIYWYTKSATENNNKASQYKLGCMYSNGQGVKQDKTIALFWLQISAEQGYDIAQIHLGIIYLFGEKDYKEAEYYLKKSAEQGNEIAKLLLQKIETYKNIDIDKNNYIIEYSNQTKKDLKFWKKNDQKKYDKINGMIKQIQKNPKKGKPLTANRWGQRSMRINRGHRIVYRIMDPIIQILSCKGRYD